MNMMIYKMENTEGVCDKDIEQGIGFGELRMLFNLTEKNVCCVTRF